MMHRPTAPQPRTHHSTERGQVMLLVSMLLLAGSFIIMSGVTALVRSQVHVTTDLTLSKTAYALAEGALEEVIYRYKSGKHVSDTETLTDDDISITTVSSYISGGREVVASGSANDRTRSVQAVIIEGDGASFNFGAQTHNGGMIMENSSSVDGNVFSNGTIEGHNPSARSDVFGTIVSAGASGSISKVHATGTVYAHTLVDSKIDQDAYYTTKDAGTIILGGDHPGSVDMATSSLPITDTLIRTWEVAASSTSVRSCSGTLTISSDTTLGPEKITCNVEISGNSTDVYINGVVWITGDLTFKNSPTIHVDSSLGNMSVPLIVDNPSNSTTSSRVVMRNSTTWAGNGSRSYVLVVSGNTSAEMGGTERAIDIQQSAGGKLLVYANHGEIVLQQSTNLTMITAWRIRLQNSTVIHYDRGLANAVFTSGPGGGYTIDSWEEVE